MQYYIDMNATTTTKNNTQGENDMTKSEQLQIGFLEDYIQRLEKKVYALENDETFNAKDARQAKNRRFHTLEQIEEAQAELNALQQ